MVDLLSLWCWFVSLFLFFFLFICKIIGKTFGGYKEKHYFCNAIKNCALIGRLAQLV